MLDEHSAKCSEVLVEGVSLKIDDELRAVSIHFNCERKVQYAMINHKVSNHFKSTSPEISYMTFYFTMKIIKKDDKNRRLCLFIKLLEYKPLNMHAIYTNMIVNGEVRDNGLNVQLHDHAHALVPMRTPSRKPRRAATQ